MADPFLAEIRIFTFNFAPRGWALCDGQLLLIAQHPDLFALLGTTYGGDGRETFALPDLRGRAPVHVSETIKLGDRGGAETHRLSPAEMPAHLHNAESIADDHASSRLDVSPGEDVHTQYFGPGDAHENMPPFQAVNFCIAIVGRIPARDETLQSKDPADV